MAAQVVSDENKIDELKIVVQAYINKKYTIRKNILTQNDIWKLSELDKSCIDTHSLREHILRSFSEVAWIKLLFENEAEYEWKIYAYHKKKAEILIEDDDDLQTEIDEFVQSNDDNSDNEILNESNILKFRVVFFKRNLIIKWKNVEELKFKTHKSNHQKNKDVDQKETTYSNKVQFDERTYQNLYTDTIIRGTYNYCNDSLGGGILASGVAGFFAGYLSLATVFVPLYGAFQAVQNKVVNDKILTHNQKVDLFNVQLQRLKDIEEKVIPKAKELQQQEEKINNKTFQIERESTSSSKVLLCVGPTGYGKSLICNRLLGDDDDIGCLEESKETLFKVAEFGDPESQTSALLKETKDVFIFTNESVPISFFRLSVVDSPGSFDSQGNDLHVLNCMKEFFYSSGGINIFCLFFKFGAKLDANYKTLLANYRIFWGDSFWKHCVIVITHCDTDTEKLKKKLNKARECTINKIKVFL
eukprot:199094_1